MNAIAPRISPSIPSTGLQGTDTAATNAPASTSHSLGTPTNNGLASLGGRQIAVGDGQVTQTLRRAHLRQQASLASGYPNLKATAGSAAPPCSDNGIARLKVRQLGNGDGRATARLRDAGAAILRLLSTLGNLLKTLLQAPLALFRSANPLDKSPQPSAAQLTSFAQEACQLVGELKDIPVPSADTPAGEMLCKQALRDIKAVGITVNGKYYPPSEKNEDMQALSRDLSAACGKTMAHWVSRYANQQILGPVSALLGQIPLGPNDETGLLPMGGSRQNYTITVLPDKSLQLDLACHWISIPALAPSDPERAGAAIVEVDPRSTITTRFSILLKRDPSAPADAPPSVSMPKPLEFNAAIKHFADQ